MHERCITRVAQAECSLGRHRRLILPPIAVLKDQARRRVKGESGTKSSSNGKNSDSKSSDSSESSRPSQFNNCG